MPKMTPADIITRADSMFDTQRPMLSQYQSLAENFYPERADFLLQRGIGTELADNLADSYPVIARRDLGNSFAAMLRDGSWFDIKADGGTNYEGDRWLQEATRRMRRETTSRSSSFARSTREGDHDYATFGQCVLSVEPNMKEGGLLIRNWHLRDVAWFDDETGQTCGVARKWRPKVYDLKRIFPIDKLSPNVQKKIGKRPLDEEDFYHVILPSDMYGDDELEAKFPYVSIFIDRTNKHIIEAKGIRNKYYVIPRFHTIGGSPYAYSPAAVVGLADARTLQAMTHTLLETAERYARPPMIATAQVITGVVDLAPDGLTWVDHEYDERLGAALRPIAQDRGGFPIGAGERQRVTEMLTEAFYLNKISLPVTTVEMTAYEVQERMKQYRRQVLPLFSPIEQDYNGQLCETMFDTMMQYNMLGSPRDIPESLQGQDIRFQFTSPLTQTEQEERLNKFTQTQNILSGAMAIDPSLVAEVDLATAMRDALEGNVPTSWLFDPEVARENKMMMAAAQAQQAQGGAANVDGSA